MSAEMLDGHEQHKTNKPMLQRGRALESAEEFERDRKIIFARVSYNESLSRPERLAARTVILTAEPFFSAGKQIGASAVGIESLQQSVLISSGPGFLVLFLLTRKGNHVFSL